MLLPLLLGLLGLGPGGWAAGWVPSAASMTLTTACLHPPYPNQAAVFAVYDDAKTLQYVGFSRGLRDSLRTLFSRRPEKAFYYRCSWECC